MDQLREGTRENTWEDYVETAGAVLAIGAGAAHFLRNNPETISQFAKYIGGVKTAFERGSFDKLNIERGWSKAKRIALNERGHIDAIDVREGRTLQTLVAGDALLNGRLGNDKKRDFINGFKTNYGKSILDQMMPTAQYLGDDQYRLLQNMADSFTSQEEMSAYAIRAKIMRDFGEKGTPERIEEATTFAMEMQRKMREITQEQFAPGSTLANQNLSKDVGTFLGFDNNGIGQWDMTRIVNRVAEDNPTERVNRIAETALDSIAAKRYQDEIASSPTEKALNWLLGQRVSIQEAEEAIQSGALSKDEFASRLIPSNSNGQPVTENTWDTVLGLRHHFTGEKRDAFNQLYVPGLRRSTDGTIYSTKGIESLISGTAGLFADTLPGRLLRTTELLYNQNSPEFLVFRKGSLDYSLATTLGNSGRELEIANDLVRMHGGIYRASATGVTEIPGMREFTVTSGRVGSVRDMLQAARDKERAVAAGKSGYFDGFHKLGVTMQRMSGEYGNQFDYFQNKEKLAESYNALIYGTADDVASIINRGYRWFGTSDRYSHLQNEMNRADLVALHKAAVDMGADIGVVKAFATARQVFNNREAAIRFASQSGSKTSPAGIQSESLAQLISDFQKDQKRTLLQHITKADQTKKAAGSVHYVSQPFEENLAQELIKDGILRLRKSSPEGIDRLEELIQRSGFRGTKQSNLRSFMATTLLNEKSGRYIYGERQEDVVKRFIETLAGENKESKFILNGLGELKTRFNFKETLFGLFPGDDVGYLGKGEAFDKTPAWAIIHKAYTFPKAIQTAKELIANANQNERTKAYGQAVRELIKPLSQFISGADKFGSMSTMSHVGYHIMDRVDDQLNRSFNLFGRHFELNLGLDKQDKGSAAAILTNLVLKRIFPAAAVITYLDFFDDTARAVLGQGLGEAGLSGLANAYLAAKKVTGATGLDYALKGLSSDSPFAQYLGGYTGDISGTWNTYEEQKDYYERGYTPIRKARFWAFGSSNEYRGGRVSYFEPNTLRMMRSNYYMESMYEGSMWTKWSHSLLPTPLNPLSPINYILDPYYLEELHKEDRPYPITGSTFAENTPWGIALNPIFDTFIKPRKQMYRNRLGEDGVDIKALITHVNNDIRRRANNQQNGDILYLQNGKLRSMLFTAFNAPTPSERIIGQQDASITTSTEYGEYGAGIEAENYPQLAESNADQMQSQAIAGSVMNAPVQSSKLSVSDKLVISSAKGNVAATALVDTMKATGVFDALRGANLKIRQQGMLRKDQGMFYENKMQYEHSPVEDLLADSETISDLMTQGKGHDYIHEMAVSTRMITGLYGYMASLAFGMGQNNQKMIATSANMESGGRAFWDLNIGGFDPTGGDIMEIMRRFIPEYHRMQQVNPLMNNMPDWLPERMRFGDPYASLPKGEARLPGRGYESLNQLHPDIYGRYGAFDRFKILADVAPYSPEYKFWKKVVGATIQDPELKKEIQEIKDRVAEQTQGHDFYDYKYVGRGMTQQNAVVSEVMNFGKFKIVGSEQVYKLSGVKIAGNPNETTQQVLSRYLLPGQEITMFMDENPAYARNNDKDQTINAGVMVAGENIAEQMMEAGDAKKRKGDTSAPSYMLNHNNIVNGLNYIQEKIGHANIPLFHSRFMNMNSPLESYKDDNVYGTSFQSWNDIWGTFIRPTLQIEASDPFWFSAGIIADIVHNNVRDEAKNGVRNLVREALEQSQLLKQHNVLASAKFRSRAAWASRFLDRGALAGFFAGHTLFMGSSKSLAKTQAIEKFGSTAGLLFVAGAAPENLGVSTIAWGRLGYLFANEVLKKNRATATIAGAAIGAARWAASQKWLASDDLANTYIPDATRKKWDMQDYFDRLTYIKYMGLFEQAADMAKEKEGIDIRAILASHERERTELREQKESLRADLRDLDRQHTVDSEEAKKILRKKLNSLSGVKLGIRGGEFTKSAIMYKNAADATMYGLQEDAVMADIVRALPKTERDYFIEFMKEKDKEKREEILKTVSPLLNRALRTIWKMPLPEKVSNEEYFVHHTLPAPTWAGWRPDIDLANVEAKVIYNQGMQFSDMGIYASQYREPAVINAPNIEYNESQNSMLLTRLKLQMALTGTGLDASKVSVEPSQDSGIQVIANVARIIPYKINEEFENLFN